LSPERFVDGCLDLLGPLTVSAKTRAALVKFVSKGGSLCLDQENHVADQRVGELLSLIASTREFQMA
jgi:4'-phosphopantetheinyl transferase EntD